MQERTEWHNVTFFGKLADIAGKYLKKGALVYIEGSLRTDKWQDKETGKDRYATKIQANSLQMLGGREGGGEAQPKTTGATPSDAPIYDDDIPF